MEQEETSQIDENFLIWIGVAFDYSKGVHQETILETNGFFVWDSCTQDSCQTLRPIGTFRLYRSKQGLY